MIRRRTAIGIVLSVLLLCAVPPAGADDGAALRIGAYVGTMSDLREPVAVAFGPTGAVHVAEAGRRRVVVLDAEGGLVRAFGAGRLVRPAGLAVAGDGQVFVVDGGGARVHVFTADGAPVVTFGGFGQGPDQLCEPRGIALRDDRVYVADTGNHRVQVFTRDGAPLATIGAFGDETGRFNRPTAVAIDDEGYVYVSDSDNSRIQRFDADGTSVATWGDWGPFVGLLDEPGGLAWSRGVLYVADVRNHRVQLFDTSGEIIEQFGSHALLPHEGEGKLHYPRDIAIDPQRGVAIVCETFEDRCQVFAARAEGEPAPRVRPPSRKLRSHFGAHLDADGRLLAIAEPEMHRTLIFEMSREIPIIIGEFGARGRRAGQMMRTTGIALDTPGGRVLLADVALRRLDVLGVDWAEGAKRAFESRRMRLRESWDLPGVAAGWSEPERPAWPIRIDAMALGSDGTLHALDGRNHRIFVLDDDLRLLRAWGERGTGEGALRGPTDLALGPDGTVYVVDADNARVQVFDPDGSFHFSVGGAAGMRGDDDGAFTRPFGVAVDGDGDGDFYVTDAVTGRVQRFDRTGSFVSSWGGRGVEHGAFWSPRGMTFDERGRLHVLDHGNHRVQVFTADGTWLVTYGTGRASTRNDAGGDVQ